VRVGVAPHSVRAVPAPWITALHAYARAHALPFHMHVAEVQGEVDACLAEHGRRPVELLADLGVLDARFVAVRGADDVEARRCALRLARFNAGIDVDEQPHKSAGFLTGVPAPVGAGLAFTPFYLWNETGIAFFRDPVVMAVWLSVIAMLMISNMATLSWASLRPRKAIRLWVLAFAALAFAALMLEPWWMLSAICVSYLALMPYGLVKYGRIKRRRAQEQAAAVASASGAAG
jgi:hypothetical protein